MNSLEITCPFCGRPVAPALAPSTRSVRCPSCHQTFAQPPSLPTQPPPGGPGGRARTGIAPLQPTSGLAIASLALSAGSVVVGPLGFVPGIVCGHLARGQIRRNPSLRGAGLALAGLIVGYAMLAFTVMLVVLGIAVFIGIQKARLAGGFPPPPRAERVEPFRTQPIGRTLQVDAANNPVSGKIEGSDFRLDEATINSGGHLNLRQTQGRPGQDIVIFLFPRAGEGVAGRVWNVPLQSNYTGTKPHVHFGWIEGNGSKRRALSDGYELRLELGQEENGVMPGRLNLRIPGNPGTEVQGDFEAKVQ